MAAKHLVKLDIRDTAFRNESESIINSCQGFEILRVDDPRKADLYVYELSDEIDHDFNLVESLIQLNVVKEMFLVGQSLAPEVLLKALRLGAKEFLSKPINGEQFKAALETFKKRVGEPEKADSSFKVGRILTFMGSKGGVGTTTVAVNLATALAQSSNQEDMHTVVIVDMNFIYGEVPLFFEMQPKYHLGEITKHISRLDPTFLMDILTKHHSGVYVLPADAYLTSAEKASGKIIDRVLTLLKRMFDFILVDCGTVINEASLKALELSDQVIIVSILNLTCLSNTSKILTSFDNLGYPRRDRIKILINRYIKQSDLTLQDASESLRKEVSWTIPNDYKTTNTAINQGQPIPFIAPNTLIHKSFVTIAQDITGHEQQSSQPRKLFGWLKTKPS